MAAVGSVTLVCAGRMNWQGSLTHFGQMVEIQDDGCLMDRSSLMMIANLKNQSATACNSTCDLKVRCSTCPTCPCCVALISVGSLFVLFTKPLSCNRWIRSPTFNHEQQFIYHEGRQLMRNAVLHTLSHTMQMLARYIPSPTFDDAQETFNHEEDSL